MTAAPLAVGTVFAGNYVSFARVLAESFRRHHPDVPFVGVLVDEAQWRFDAQGEGFPILELSELEIPRLDELVARYSRFQLAVAAKPFLLEQLLDGGYETALFLDPDMLVLGKLDELLNWARESPITVVPHLLEPLALPDGIDRELNVLQSGVFNGGVVGVTESVGARRFLGWWQDRIHRHCRHSLDEGLHYDQRWLDLTLAFFPELRPFRDPRFNVAHWNLPERLAHVDDWRLFHFSGYEPAQPSRVTRYSNRVLMHDALRPLFEGYQASLEAAGCRETAA